MERQLGTQRKNCHFSEFQCQYPALCSNERATKPNGDLHWLCEGHRERQNATQRARYRRIMEKKDQANVQLRSEPARSSEMAVGDPAKNSAVNLDQTSAACQAKKKQRRKRASALVAMPLIGELRNDCSQVKGFATSTVTVPSKKRSTASVVRAKSTNLRKKPKHVAEPARRSPEAATNLAVLDKSHRPLSTAPVPSAGPVTRTVYVVIQEGLSTNGDLQAGFDNGTVSAVCEAIAKALATQPSL